LEIVIEDASTKLMNIYRMFNWLWWNQRPYSCWKGVIYILNPV